MPVRRYLRVSKYTVLETRIYLDNPTLLTSWFLHPRDPALPKVIEAVRGMVLPKLREETESVLRGGAKGKKNRAVKDIVTGGKLEVFSAVQKLELKFVAHCSLCTDGFEVVVFLTEGGTRHAVLSKTRLFQAPKARIKSNSSNLLNMTEADEVHIRAESEEIGDEMELQNIPMTTEVGPEDDAPGQQDDVILVETSDEEEDDAKDEKKPLSRTTYDGFSIYSRVLCLVVKKLDAAIGRADSGVASTDVPLPEIETYAERPRADSGRGMMEDWITMTQIARQDQDAREI